MKFLAFAVVLACVGCSDSQTSPSSVLASSSTPSAVSGPTAAPSPTANPSPVPGKPLEVVGPTGCQTVTGDIIWDVTINDAGIDGVRGFTVHANHSGKAGCAATNEDERAEYWLKHTAGPTSYLPHTSGVSRFAAQNRWTCGRDQFDILIDGQGLIVALVVDHKVDCPEDKPAPPVVPPVIPPVVPPVDPPAVCYPTKDLFLGPIHKTHIGEFVLFEYYLNPAYPNAMITVASYQRTGSEWLPQSLISTPGRPNPLTFNASLNSTARITVASCGAQVDIFPCDYAPNPLDDSNIVEASAKVIDWWDDSPSCPGMRAPSRAHLWVR